MKQMKKKLKLIEMTLLAIQKELELRIKTLKARYH